MRIIIGIIAMVVLFIGFLIAFITIQRKKTEYHQNIQALLEEEQKLLARQNQELERKVNERTDQINKQKEELEDSLIELKKTQQILIQTEKMASLGEVTSGIAHEIQNPLNFINNFSDVSVEMFEEMMDAYRKGDKDEMRELANEILDNLKKIHFHGKRADAIVKSMQAHTRVGSGKREFVDLNQIIRDGINFLLNTPKYKDLLEKEQIEFYPNPDVKPLWIIPQDISRVIESTLSNAAYWTLKKEKQGVADYKPLIKINITDLQSETEISISDNGLGITEQSINKIFQPFYTTKPAGEGTGLGLSLTYDIITRGYGGSISVKSKEGEGATFIVRIPKQNP